MHFSLISNLLSLLSPSLLGPNIDFNIPIFYSCFGSFRSESPFLKIRNRFITIPNSTFTKMNYKEGLDIVKSTAVFRKIVLREISWLNQK
jgi:hypothetical protein